MCHVLKNMGAPLVARGAPAVSSEQLASASGQICQTLPHAQEMPNHSTGWVKILQPPNLKPVFLETLLQQMHPILYPYLMHKPISTLITRAQALLYGFQISKCHRV